MASATQGFSAAGLDLAQSVADETDEERRARLLKMQQQNLLPNSTAATQGLLASGYSAALPGIS
jgi:hypothetical protein